MKQSGHLTMPALNLTNIMKHTTLIVLVLTVSMLTGCITFTVKDNLDPSEVKSATDVIESVGGTIAKDF